VSDSLRNTNTVSLEKFPIWGNLLRIFPDVIEKARNTKKWGRFIFVLEATTRMTMRIEYLFLLPLLAALVITTTSVPVFASTGMNDGEEGDRQGEGDTQPDRVGNDEEDDEDADRDGPDENDDANCWGKVTSELAEGEGIGEHSSDPVGGDDDNETPREGVGNQEEGHPSDHADTVGPRFGSDEECTQDDD
jgi:hypothetical protein